jgi:hypothetical protein
MEDVRKITLKTFTNNQLLMKVDLPFTRGPEMIDLSSKVVSG